MKTINGIQLDDCEILLLGYSMGCLAKDYANGVEFLQKNKQSIESLYDKIMYPEKFQDLDKGNTKDIS